MKRNRLPLILLIIFTLTSTGTAPTFSAVKPKSAGRTATTLPNTILNGKGAPISKLGIDGDFYIDTRSLSLYGPKKSGKWPSAQSLQGATGAIGAAGSDGRNGNDGRTTSNATSVTGPSGTQGEKGDAGAAGLPGASGLPGPSGPAGAKGDTGNSGGGPAGAKGDTGSQGAVGAKGETGTAGSNGTDGSVGAAGAKGETGTVGNNGAPGSIGETGPVGPSLIQISTIPSWTLSSATEFSYVVSPIFETFTAGISYKYTIIINGVTNLIGGTFGCEVILSDLSTPIFEYSSNDYKISLGGVNSYRYTFRIEGVAPAAAFERTLRVKIVDGTGGTGTKPMVLSGKSIKTIVGNVEVL